MPDHRPRSSYELDGLRYTKATARRVVRISIGQELRTCCEVPQDLSDEMLTLLMQASAPTQRIMTGRIWWPRAVAAQFYLTRAQHGPRCRNHN
jgi:hypothetical protein